jgi:hypothetical protein
MVYIGLKFQSKTPLNNKYTFKKYEEWEGKMRAGISGRAKGKRRGSRRANMVYC